MLSCIHLDQKLLPDEPPRLTIIDYYPVIYQPITDNKAVQECLRYSEQGARKIGQKRLLNFITRTPYIGQITVRKNFLCFKLQSSNTTLVNNWITRQSRNVFGIQNKEQGR
jgi:hypothetical protein